MDLTTLEQVYTADGTDRPGPYATVYLDVDGAVENAADRIALHWRDARDALVGAGADPATLDAMEAAVLGDVPAHGTTGRVVVGTGGEVVLDRALPQAPEVDLTRWSRLPHLMPMVTAAPPARLRGT